MPQTDPFHSMVPRKMSDAELVRAIRLDIESELDAINLYSSHIEATDNEDAKRVIRHVMNEEKEHAMLFVELLKRLDPKQAEEAIGASAKVAMLIAGASDEEVEAAEETMKRLAPGEAPSPRSTGPRLTVGDLKGK